MRHSSTAATPAPIHGVLKVEEVLDRKRETCADTDTVTGPVMHEPQQQQPGLGPCTAPYLLETVSGDSALVNLQSMHCIH